MLKSDSLASVIVGKIGKSSSNKDDFAQKLGETSEGESPLDAEPDEDAIALEAVADDMIQAFSAKNSSALASALSDFIDMVTNKNVQTKLD